MTSYSFRNKSLFKKNVRNALIDEHITQQTCLTFKNTLFTC
jgi:hypothetical protein